jgi:hypothetical protein
VELVRGTMMDYRKEHRTLCARLILLQQGSQSDAQPTVCVVEDCSTQGCLILSEQRLAVGAAVYLGFCDLPLRAHVRHCSKREDGLFIVGLELAGGQRFPEGRNWPDVVLS